MSIMQFVRTFFGDKAIDRKEPISPPNDGKKRICVIDDDGFIRNWVAECLKPHTVVGLRMLPLDVSELNNYDIVIVDGNGIGNEKWANGVDFLMDYTPLNPLQKLMHFSGYISVQDEMKLNKKGIMTLVKGHDFRDYVDLILK